MVTAGLGAEALTFEGRALHRGATQGELLVLSEPLSFWGGSDSKGRIIDAHHPQHGLSLAGRVVAMPVGRGSSSSSSVLAEAIRSGSAPAAILLAEVDLIIVLGALVAAELYDRRMPVVLLDRFDRLPPAGRTQVRAGTTRATVIVEQD